MRTNTCAFALHYIGAGSLANVLLVSQHRVVRCPQWRSGLAFARTSSELVHDQGVAKEGTGTFSLLLYRRGDIIKVPNQLER